MRYSQIEVSKPINIALQPFALQGYEAGRSIQQRYGTGHSEDPVPAEDYATKTAPARS